MKLNNDKLNKAKSLGILNRLGDEDITQNKSEIDIDLIDFNIKNFYSQGDDEEDIVELAESIEEIGLMHNIVVKPVDNGRYVLISGEKRTKAYKYLYEKTNDAKWKLIPCKIKDDIANDTDEEIALIKANRDVRERSESVKAKEVERLEALYGEKKAAGEKVGVIRKKIAKDLGISETQVQRYKSVNALIPEFKGMLDSGDITLTAVEHFSVFDKDVQKEIFDSLTSKGEKINRDDAKAIKEQVKSTLEDTQAEDVQNVTQMKNNLKESSHQEKPANKKNSDGHKEIVNEIGLEVQVSQCIKKASKVVKELDAKALELIKSNKNISQVDAETVKNIIKTLQNLPFSL